MAWSTEEDRIAIEYTDALQARIRASAALCVAALGESNARAESDRTGVAHHNAIQLGEASTPVGWDKTARPMRLADDAHKAALSGLFAAVDAYAKAEAELRRVAKRYTEATREAREGATNSAPGNGAFGPVRP